jgi:leucyl aminopeptidase
MKKVSISSLYNAKKESIIFPFFENEVSKPMRKAFEPLSRAQTRAVKNMMKTEGIKKSGIFPVFSLDKTVFVFFLGKKEEATSRSIREKGEKIFSIAKKYQLQNVSVAEGGLWKSKNFWKNFCEGVAIGCYEFNEYKGKKFTDAQKKSQEKSPGKITLLAEKNSTEENRLNIIYQSTQLTKDIINTPPSIANPEYVSVLAKKTFEKIKNVKVSVIKEKELKKLGAGGILGVGQASNIESRFLVIEYSGGKKSEKPLGVVGKGVTYDTGGLSLKPAQYMKGMKQDLGGCATVLGGMLAISSLEIKKNVVSVTPLAENLVSRDAYKPDDVVTMMNGKTVEVTNTDAEGRLLLGDALCYIESTFSPKAIIDLATLTGACAYAVGNDFTAALGNNQDCIDTVLGASKNIDEPVWQLPLHKRYEEFLRSPIADLVNSTGGKLKAGTIEAALFLSNFVNEKTPWCHLDIASVAFDESKGMATGRNVRLLIDIAENF